jgi:hypothetical protein
VVEVEVEVEVEAEAPTTLAPMRAPTRAPTPALRMEDGRTFEDGDGIDVLSLKRLTEMHLEILGGA